MTPALTPFRPSQSGAGSASGCYCFFYRWFSSNGVIGGRLESGFQGSWHNLSHASLEESLLCSYSAPTFLPPF
jgi:hypothetical protein